MKKIILLIVIGGSWTFANAQVEKGTVLLGTSSKLGGSRSQVLPGGPTFKEFDFEIEGGYFVTEKLIFGSTISIGKFDRLVSKGNFITVTPFARYFVTRSMFLGVGYSFGREKGEKFSRHPISGENVWAKNKLKIGMQLLEAGYAIWLTDNISLEPTLNYSYIYPGSISRSQRALGFKVGLKIYL